jgi:hypothetical protein
MFEFDDASSFVMRGQISRETRHRIKNAIPKRSTADSRRA